MAKRTKSRKTVTEIRHVVELDIDDVLAAARVPADARKTARIIVRRVEGDLDVPFGAGPICVEWTRTIERTGADVPVDVDVDDEGGE